MALMLADNEALAAIAGVTLSHPDKQLFPESKLSKRDLALYYAAVADGCCRTSKGGH